MNSYNGLLAIGVVVMGLPLPSISASPLLADIGRDPFQAVSATSCDNEQKKLTGWQLQGFVSGNGYQSGWIKRPNATWQKLAPGTRLLPEWQVTQIRAQQVDVQYQNPEMPCPGLSATISFIKQ